MRSNLEVYDFIKEKPKNYSIYVKTNDNDLNEAITWTGQKLGAVTLKTSYRDNFGGTRQSIIVHGINGVIYYGTYYTSSGNYARIKAYK